MYSPTSVLGCQITSCLALIRMGKYAVPVDRLGTCGMTSICMAEQLFFDIRLELDSDIGCYRLLSPTGILKS